MKKKPNFNSNWIQLVCVCVRHIAKPLGLILSYSLSFLINDTLTHTHTKNLNWIYISDDEHFELVQKWFDSNSTYSKKKKYDRIVIINRVMWYKCWWRMTKKKKLFCNSILNALPSWNSFAQKKNWRSSLHQWTTEWETMRNE